MRLGATMRLLADVSPACPQNPERLLEVGKSQRATFLA
jgi:hypothetical protein